MNFDENTTVGKAYVETGGVIAQLELSTTKAECVAIAGKLKIEARRILEASIVTKEMDFLDAISAMRRVHEEASKLLECETPSLENRKKIEPTTIPTGKIAQRLAMLFQSDNQAEEETDIGFCRQLAIDEAPVLVDLHIDTTSTNRFYGGHVICPTNEDERLGIAINDLPLEAIAGLMKMRTKSTELVAALLGMKVEQITPRLLRAFIILHEYGHAFDFLENFLKPQIAAGNPTPNTAAYKQWCDRFSAEMALLPIPHVDPSALHAKSFIPLEYRAKEKGASADVLALVRSDPAALLRKQEEVYKSGESEQRADAFAVRVLKKYAAA